MKSKKLRDSARLRDCTIQIHPYCNGNPETSVLCHLPSESKGIGKKSEDFFAAIGCSTCHDIIDKRRFVDIPEIEIHECMMRGLHRTLLIWIEEGLIKVV